MLGFFGRDSRGQGSVELLLALLMLLPILFGAFEIGRGISLKHSMDIGVARAVRYLSILPSDWTTAEEMIREEVNRNVLGGSYGDQLSITILDEAGSEISPSELANLPFGSRFGIRAEVEYQASVPLVSLPLATIRVEHYSQIERFP
jgi:hypothetical protein